MAGKRKRPDICVLKFPTHVEVVGTTQRGILYLERTEPEYPNMDLSEDQVELYADKWRKGRMLVDITEL